jgi:hypothetical protein
VFTVASAIAAQSVLGRAVTVVRTRTSSVRRDGDGDHGLDFVTLQMVLWH